MTLQHLLLLLYLSITNSLKLKITITIPFQKRQRNLEFTTASNPTTTAHRFCSRQGILDHKCHQIATEISKQIAQETQGLHIASPTASQQIPVPSTYNFQLINFNSNQSITTTCLFLQTTLNNGQETTTRKCVDGIPSNFPITFNQVGYHFATFSIGTNNTKTNTPTENTFNSVASTSVAFTSVSLQPTNSKAQFFDAYCDSIKPGDPPPRPMSRRPMALLSNELMFRSTGTSNPGHNFPGFWLPSAGICPEWFLNYNSPINSFLDIENKKINQQEGTVLQIQREPDALDYKARARLRTASLAVFSMIDKRFDVGKTQYYCTLGQHRSIQGIDVATKYNVTSDTCKTALVWKEHIERFSKDWIENQLIDYDAVKLSGSEETIETGKFMLNRFYNLRTIVTSIRLGPEAWHSNGYWEAAKNILIEGNKKGLETNPVVREDLREKILAGICEVNQFIHHKLGFQIQGWDQYYQHACTVEDRDSNVERRRRMEMEGGSEL